MTAKEIQAKLNALKNFAKPDVLKNRVFNYGQQVQQYEKAKDASNYAKAKANYEKAKKELEDYNNRAKALVDQLQAAQKLEKVTSDLAKAKKDRDFYVNANEPIPGDVQKKYTDLANEAKRLGIITKSGPEVPEGMTSIPTRATNAFGPGIPTKSTTATGPAGASKATGPAGPKATGPAGPKATGSTGPKPTNATGTDVPITGIDNIIKAAVAAGFGGIDTIFKTVPELTNILTRAVNEKWTPARFQSELQNTNWFKSNATALQQRGFYKRQYQDLVNAIPAGAADRQSQIDVLGSSTEYGRGLASVKRLIQSEAIAEGAVIDDKALSLLAQDIYDHALENDGLAIRDYVKAQIKYNPNAILSGKAGRDLADLKATAMANGLDLDKAFGSSIQGWLQKLAGGESVETYKNLIRQSAKTGMSDRVQSLLDNGMDLESIYSPYRDLMANTLEINPNEIKLGDIISKATTPKGEINLYDFAKSLRTDPRWEYTKQAHQEVSNATQKVLQDFGFMG